MSLFSASQEPCACPGAFDGLPGVFRCAEPSCLAAATAFAAELAGHDGTLPRLEASRRMICGHPCMAAVLASGAAQHSAHFGANLRVLSAGSCAPLPPPGAATPPPLLSLVGPHGAPHAAYPRRAPRVPPGAHILTTGKAEMWRVFGETLAQLICVAAVTSCRAGVRSIRERQRTGAADGHCVSTAPQHTRTHAHGHASSHHSAQPAAGRGGRQ